MRKPWRSTPAGANPPEDEIMKGRPPYFLALRSSTNFIALTVGLGVLTDLSGYGLVVPVVPFRLQALGYDNIGSKTGWLVAAYAAGLIASSPPIAYLGNKVSGRRAPLIVALLFMIGAIILFMETASFTAMVISRILQGISGTGIWTLGLSLVTDSVPEERVGTVMGWVMIGFSVGTLIGPPVGGVLYARLGYRAPFVFSLCLLFVDLVLRLLVIEKYTALKWVKAGVVIPNFEAPGYTPPTKANTEQSDSQIEVIAPAPIPLRSVPDANPVAEVSEEEGKPGSEAGTPSQWNAVLNMLVMPRALSCFALTMLNGVVLGGNLDTGMTLWLEHQYNLTSLGAGLVFMGCVVPTFVASPFAGWVADKYGAKWIAVFGMLLSAPSLLLLIIPGPLPLFIFFLVLLGISLSFFLTPTMQDLALVVTSTPGLPSTACYGMFNMCYSIGAFIGPIIGGQLIAALEIKRGWIAMSALSSGLTFLILPAVIIWMGGPIRSSSPKTSKDDEEGQVTPAVTGQALA